MQGHENKLLSPKGNEHFKDGDSSESSSDSQSEKVAGNYQEEIEPFMDNSLANTMSGRMSPYHPLTDKEEYKMREKEFAMYQQAMMYQH